jgi:hypothetical protein
MKSMPRSGWFVLSLAFAIGCGGNGAADHDAGVGDGDAMTPRVDASPGDIEILDVMIGPITVDAGEEDTVCVVVPLGNVDVAAILSVETELSAGTHHVIVHLSDEPAQPTPVGCGAFAGSSHDDIVFIAQQPTAELVYPSGTALYVDANQNVHLEMHFFNYLPGDTADVQARVRIELLRDPPTDLSPVDLLFTGGPGGAIPPMSTATWQSFNPVPDGDAIFALTTHMHSLGVRGTIYRATGESDPNPELLYETTSWDEAPLEFYEPFTLDEGEGLLLRCEYDNPTDEPVGFGLGFADEMCFLWAHLYTP